jgi:hypothetical protein
MEPEGSLPYTQVRLGCYRCIFHRTGNSAQLCRNFGISGLNPPSTPLGTPLNGCTCNIVILIHDVHILIPNTRNIIKSVMCKLWVGMVLSRQGGSTILHMHTTLLLTTIPVSQMSFEFDFIPLFCRQSDSCFWNKHSLTCIHSCLPNSDDFSWPAYNIFYKLSSSFMLYLLW